MDDLFLQSSEDEFQQWVTDLATLHGWRWTHFRAAREQSGNWATPLDGDKGWPDLTLVRGPVMMFRELKTETGVLSAEQASWLRDIHYAGGDADVWRPRDRKLIEDTLNTNRTKATS